MGIHLVGGGRSLESAADVYRGFVAEAAARAAATGRVVPRIRILLVADDEERSERVERTEALLHAGGPCDPVTTALETGEPFGSSVLSDVDALLIGGGHTPSYLEAVLPIVDEIRLLVSDGLPYLGFSAGAMIAPDRAILGGWRIGGVQVAAEETGEDLDEVVVAEGLGLIDIAVDVHAAQWGTLTRLVAATEAELVDGGVAIDEDTVLVVGDRLEVRGAGSVWQVVQGPDGTLVGTMVP